MAFINTETDADIYPQIWLKDNFNQVDLVTDSPLRFRNHHCLRGNMHSPDTSILVLLLCLQTASTYTTETATSHTLSFDDVALGINTCPASEIQELGNKPFPRAHTGWVRSEACTTSTSSEFCSFSNPSYNNGFGLSVITTAKRLQELSSLPALTQLTTEKAWREAAPRYQLEEVPGKGYGLVANRHIAAGDLILSRTPSILVDDYGFKDLGNERLEELLVQAVRGLPQQHQAQYLNLSSHGEVESHEERVYQVFANNNYRIKVHNQITAEFHGTFIDGSPPPNIASSIPM